jgi:ABC-type transport system substrate-binding protein
MAAQASPRAGGELIFVVPAEPPSYDAHREETFAVVHPAAPHYNTLLRVDPADRTGTRIVGDLAASWTAARDGRAYTFSLRRGVRFHDGSELTSADVKASYDKIIFPPPGVVSNRQGEYRSVEAVEAPDPSTVVFRLKWPAASFVASLASPFNWIYKADILARDVHWYEKNVMGTGPFLFVEPDLALFKFQSTDVSPVNYSRYVDRTLDALYEKQSRTADRDERRRYIRDFEKRLLVEEAHYIYTFQWHRIVPHSARVRGWTITPSHILNNQLDTVWLAE